MSNCCNKKDINLDRNRNFSIRPNTWVDLLKTQLGYPVINLAITDEMILKCIQMAINEIEPYLTEAELINGSGGKIDLSGYEVQCIVRVWRQNNNLLSTGSSGAIDEFALFNLAPFAGSTTYGTSTTFGRASSYLGYDFSSSQTVTKSLLQGVAMRNLYLTELEALVPQDWRLIDNYLYTSGFTGDVIIEAITTKSLNHMTRTQENWCKRFALAKMKQIEGEIRSKVTIEGAPISLNGDALKSEGQSEEEALKEKLGNELGLFFATR